MQAQSGHEVDKRFSLRWQPQKSGVTASLRGLSAVNDRVAWASGSGGQTLRTLDGGESWHYPRVPGADSLDFRDVEAFDADTAYLMSAGAGEKSRIYKTVDGGRSWRLQFQTTLPEAFFDGMAFWDREHGIAYSDPVGGKHVIVTTADGGQTWVPVAPEHLPALHDGEYGFAASGTGICALGPSRVWICSGGAAARIFHSSDRGKTWWVTETPLVSGTPSSGIFSIAFRDAQNGVAVGGDHAQPQAAAGNAARTRDGGRTWQLLAEPATVGYRSCVAYVPQTAPPVVVAVGSHATSYSLDDGLTWTLIDTVGYHTLNFGSGKAAGWAAGADGRVAKLHIRDE
ncbi:MAG: WD40/YVTN/BNR-like repeat-containing protein [bacterium]